MAVKNEEITLVGSGLAGSLLAILLAKRGHTINVYEKREDPRTSEAIGGRSINLALSHRGWKALKKAGIDEQVHSQAIPMKGRMMHDIKGNLTFQPYGTEGQMIYSISRSGLNEALIQLADQHKEVSYHFNSPCEEVNIRDNTVIFSTEKEQLNVKSNLIIGSDGAFSKVRAAMQKTDRFNYSQHYIDHGYKELTIPPSESGEFRLEPNALHIWPRKSYMLIALPNQDKSFTATLFFPFQGSPSFDELQTEDDVQHFFEENFPDTLELIPHLKSEFFINPTSSLVTVRCDPWVYKNKVMLIGDAAHAIVPFYGQGMNAAFEDCTVFDDLLIQHGSSWSTILPEYQKLRVENGNAIADLALRNFIEMRDSVADPDFLLQKKIESKLHEIFPKKWIPLYTMVTFSNYTYAEALKIGQIQDKIMEKVMQEDGIHKNWESIDWQEHPVIQEYIDKKKSVRSPNP